MIMFACEGMSLQHAEANEALLVFLEVRCVHAYLCMRRAWPVCKELEGVSVRRVLYGCTIAHHARHCVGRV